MIQTEAQPHEQRRHITDPKFAAQYRPAGKPAYFRTVTTDAYQGPNMANYFADILKVKGRRSNDISRTLGYKVADEIIHRNNFALIEELA